MHLKKLLSSQSKFYTLWLDNTCDFPPFSPFRYIDFYKYFINRLCPISPRCFWRNNSAFFIKMVSHFCGENYMTYFSVVAVSAGQSGLESINAQMRHCSRVGVISSTGILSFSQHFRRVGSQRYCSFVHEMSVSILLEFSSLSLRGFD